MLSVGVPIGLGIYWAWVNRDWSAKAKTTGFAAATGGALVGAWLGFQRDDRPARRSSPRSPARLVGANLALIVLDIVWDRQARDRFAATDVNEALEVRPA